MPPGFAEQVREDLTRRPLAGGIGALQVGIQALDLAPHVASAASARAFSSTTALAAMAAV